MSTEPSKTLIYGDALMKVRLYLLSVIFLFLSTFKAVAIPPPDNASSDSVNITDTIMVKLSGVDDIGLVIVWNGNGAETVANCEWSGGSNGYASKEISKYLTKGKNYIVFAIYNKVYQGGLFFSGGKWSGEMSIKRNGNNVWSASKYVRNNTRGLKYWKVIKADVSSNGSISFSETIPSRELRSLRSAMSELENKLDQNTGIATPF